MMNWLFGQGYRRIAFINGPDELLASKERLKGYIEGFYRKKVKVDMQMVETTDLSKESTCEALKKLLSLKHPPNAIITFNEYVHFDAVQYARLQNLKINKDIVFVSYAHLPMTVHSAFPPIASMEQHPYQHGEKAMEIMMKLLQLKEAGKDLNNHFYTEEMQVGLVINDTYKAT
jgi:DNA-binding LacI/PurR family transcriptional regulator